MKVLFYLFALLPVPAFGASCCIGGGAKSFISLARLQKYEVGLSSAARNVYGRFDSFGEVEESDRNQTLSVSLGAGMRLSEDLQVSATVPWVYRRSTYSRTSLGDVILGAQYTVLEALFQDDWYPTVHLSGGVKAPSGTLDSIESGRRFPGSGNGIWEPFAGVAIEKPLGPITAAIRATYTWRLQRGDVDEGDMIELIESVSYQLDPRLSLAGGLSQSWTRALRSRGEEISDSHSRIINAFVSPTYFLSRFWSVSAGAEISLAVSRFGVNQQAAQSLTLTTKYGFY